MKALLIFFVLSLPNFSLAQNLPDNVTCQDLIDLSNGRLSRIADGGNTYVPIRAPQPKDAFGAALISHDTYLCQRLSRGEISVAELTALHDEKALQLQVDRAKVLTDRQKVLMEQKNLENQQKALQNQQE